MKIVTYELQRKIKEMFNSWALMYNEAVDIEKAYFATGASTWIAGKADGDAVTANTKLSKADYVAGITFIQQVGKFFGNQALATADNLVTINKLKYGATSGATNIPVYVESIGDRMLQIATDALSLYNSSKDAIKIYFDNYLGTLSGLPDQAIIWGSDMTKSDMTSAITLLDNWIKLMSNQAASQADYFSTITKWERIEI